MTRLALLVVLLLAIAAPTSADLPTANPVSPHAFRAVELNQRKHVVQVTWGASGVLEHQWRDADGRVWRRKRYRTTLGAGTWIWATYRLTLTGEHWRLRDKQWCLINDTARGGVPGPGGYTYICEDHPWI